MKRSGRCVECNCESGVNLLCPKCYGRQTKSCCECMGKDFDSRGRCVGCLHALAIILDKAYFTFTKELREEADNSMAAWETFIQTPLDKRWEIVFKDLYDRGLL